LRIYVECDSPPIIEY